jgi:hypothetical protein
MLTARQLRMSNRLHALPADTPITIQWLNQWWAMGRPCRESSTQTERPLGRNPNLCRRGHALTPDNAVVWGDGRRRCIACTRLKRGVAPETYIKSERQRLQSNDSVEEPDRRA